MAHRTEPRTTTGVGQIEPDGRTGRPTGEGGVPDVGPATTSRRLRGVVVAVLLTLLVVVALGAALRSRGGGGLGASPVGQTAPDFTLPLLDGSGELTLSDLRGTPVMLNFWASWCVPCKEEAPVLAAGWERWEPEGVLFLGVNAQDSTTWALEFEEEYGIRYQSVMDGTGGTMARYGVLGFPETFFIDIRGRIVAKHVGPLDAETLDANVQALIGPGG